MFTATQLAEFTIAGMIQIYQVELGVCYIRIWFVSPTGLRYVDIQHSDRWIELQLHGVRIPYSEAAYFEILKVIMRKYWSQGAPINLGKYAEEKQHLS